MPRPRDYIFFYLNHEPQRVAGSDAFLSLSDFLRTRRRLVGTKVVCEEGDCGACTVLLGRPHEDRMAYQPIDSCIYFVFQLDGTHVVTVEGLARDDDLHPVQEALVHSHGSQCGFCTPGIVMAMTAECERRDDSQDPDWRLALTGNLCRCTGYSPILEAGAAIASRNVPRLAEQFDEVQMFEDLGQVKDTTIAVDHADADRVRQLYAPRELGDALRFLDQPPQALIVAGATDLGVQINKRRIAPDTILDINRIPFLEGWRRTDDCIVAGSCATWTELEQAAEQCIPELHAILMRFGAPQIRNVATIGGNVANASPIADSLPTLYVVEAEVELESTQGKRVVNINDFYLGYKQIDRRPNEIITEVRIPIPRDNQILRLYKVSRRRDLDIASFTAAIMVTLDDARIAEASIAFGAVGPTVIRARQVEQFLQGRALTRQTMEQAGDVAVAEIAPISDVRGTEDFRFQLSRNVLVKFYYDVVGE